MMRELKFRAWDEENNEMLYPEYDGCFTVENGTRYAIGGDGKIMSVYIEQPVVTKPKLMQYTGLKDKNGTEIYEGDIIKCDILMHIDSKLPHMGEVVYCDRLASFATKNDAGETLFVKHYPGSREVIGNKFEHPELLEQ